MISRLPQPIQGLILDMDGVLWKADVPIGNLPAIFARIKERGLKVVFATNNGTKSPGQYAKRLAELGVQINPEQVITSALGVAHILSQKFPRGGPVFAIGETGVMDALRDKNFEPLSVENAPKAQAVVASIDRQINFNKMMEATLLIRSGVPFYATNPDKTFPTPRGEIPGAGAWISVLTMATNIEPIYAGKPFPYLMELSLERLGTRREETLVVGDRLETDMIAGQAVGCLTALVLSGVSTKEQAQAWTPKLNLIARDLTELIG
ncbi:MAG: HAD-IIA family hydrolase [Chloroflexi bacterium]|nr:HAD-IIA family hydrolase [Chloroflexota bacterium]MBI3339647.1 HAD-IIA family hydrolase [Chloroflexota bacterium]